MKKVNFLFVWVLCLICMPASAQTSELEYRPFAQDGKYWKSRVGLTPENIYYNSIDGDTLIDGESWKKVYNSMYMPGTRTPTYYAAIRDVGRKVYAIAKGSNRPRLLYDFGLKEGDMVMCGVEGNAFGCLLDKDEKVDTLMGFPFISFLMVECIDTIEVCGLKHRRFTLTLLDAFQECFRNGEDSVFQRNVVWVEGVGSGAGPFSPWLPIPPEGSLFLSCYVNKDCVFSSPGFYENGEPATIGNALYNKDEEGFIYDLHGRRLITPPANSIYIQNGKKVVIK
jgi:hypothetical protein